MGAHDEERLWRRLTAQHLDFLRGSGQERAAVEEEVAQILRDEAEGEGVDCADPDAAACWLQRHRERLCAMGRELQNDLPPPSPVVGAPDRHGGMMTGLKMDVMTALRSWMRRPGLALVVLSTLVLGIGLNAAVFSVLDNVLFRPLAVADAGELLRVYNRVPNGFLPEEPMAFPDIEDLRDLESLEDVGAQAMTFAALSVDEGAEIVIGELVTDNLFDLLGVVPLRGRLLQGDGLRGSEGNVAVLSEASWRRRFDADPAVVGSTVRINGNPVEVVGIVPSGFKGLARAIEPEIWLPLDVGLRIDATPSTNSGNGEILESRGRRSLWTVVRVRDDFSRSQASADIAAFAEALAREFPDSNEGREMVTVPFEDVMVLPAFDGSVSMVSMVILGVVFLVLLIACANLANLLLARALTRRGEMATRLSLGASRGRIVRQLLIESLMLSVVGAIGGLVVALLAIRAVNSIRLDMIVPLQLSVSLDGRAVLFTVAVAVLTALLFGLSPALEASRTNLASVMKDGSQRAGGRRMRTQTAMVVAQVAFSVVLLVFAGLALRSVVRASQIDPGFEFDGVAGLTLHPSMQGYEEDEVTSFHRRLREEIARDPRVEAVASASHVPLTTSFTTGSMVPASRLGEDTRDWPDIDTAWVDDSYFELMGVPLLSGRTFERADIEQEARVLIVNEAAAMEFWGRPDVVGESLWDDPEREPRLVVGVVANGKYRTLGEEPRPFVWQTLADGTSMRTVLARFARPEQADEEPLVAAVRSIDPHLAVSGTGTLAEIIGTSLIIPRVAAGLFGVMGLIGLLLAATGLFGVLAYSVRQRTHEIGLRIAVGASTADVLVLVARRGMVVTGVGVVLGLGLAMATSRFLSQMLYVGPLDWLTFLGVAVVLLLTALVASLAPARRALRVSPVEALRVD